MVNNHARCKDYGCHVDGNWGLPVFGSIGGCLTQIDSAPYEVLKQIINHEKGERMIFFLILTTLSIHWSTRMLQRDRAADLHTSGLKDVLQRFRGEWGAGADSL